MDNGWMMFDAYTKGGYRERYAMDHGRPEMKMYGDHKVVRFWYDSKDDYQDANGATWDTVTKQWIG